MRTERGRGEGGGERRERDMRTEGRERRDMRTEEREAVFQFQY